MSEHQGNGSAPHGATACYLRVSGEDQRRRGTIENQRPDLDRYLNAYNITPYGWYEDEAVSGHWVPFAERPQGRRLLADAQAGHVGLVLVWKLDRLGRNAYEVLGSVRLLEAAGARLVSLKESFDTREAAGRLMLGVLASVAEFEWSSIQERGEAGTLRKLARADGTGWMGGPVPYGYRVEGTAELARLVPDETPLGIPDYPSLTAADVVRLIYTLTVDEHLTGEAIAGKLNAMGVPTSYARRHLTQFHRGEVDKPALLHWRRNTITNMISNTTYKGERQFGRRARHNAAREVVTYPVPALVSVETWDAAQRVMESNQIASMRNAHRDYLLRGLMRCAYCGHVFVGDGDYYVCNGRRRAVGMYGRDLADQHRCRESRRLRAAKVEGEIWAEVEHYIRHPDEALDELAAQQGTQQGKSADIRTELAKKQQEQAAMQDDRDQIWTQFRKGGTMTEQDRDRQLMLIAREQADIERDMA